LGALVVLLDVPSVWAFGAWRWASSREKTTRHRI
jgi:hypothetical protein